jgi:hypothetical protein
MQIGVMQIRYMQCFTVGQKSSIGQNSRHKVVRHSPKLPPSPGDCDPLGGLRGDSPQQPGPPAAGWNSLELVTPGGFEGAAGPDRRSFEPEAVVSPQPPRSPIIQGLPVQFSR